MISRNIRWKRKFTRMETFFLLLIILIHMFGFSLQVSPDIDPDRLSKSAKFVADLNHKLQVTPLKTHNVKDLLECTLECLGHDGCLSINIAKNVVGGLKVCQLLSIDKKDSPADLVASDDFHYYDSGLVREKTKPFLYGFFNINVLGFYYY